MSVLKCRLCRLPVSVGTAQVEPGPGVDSIVHRRCGEIQENAMDLQCGDVFFLDTLQPFRIPSQDPK